jgi:hypothetical protein
MVFTIAWFVGTPAIAFILFRAAFPLGVFTAPLNQVAAVAAGIKGSAKKLGPLVCAGHIGWVHYGGPLLRLHIYSHGVIIHPVLLPEIPLQFQEISTPTRREGWFFSRLSLSHCSGMVRQPVELIFYSARHRDLAYDVLSAGGAS